MTKEFFSIYLNEKLLTLVVTIPSRVIRSHKKKNKNKKGFPGYDIKLHLMVKFQFRGSRECEIPFHCPTPF